MIDEKVLIERLEEFVQSSDKKYHYLVDNAGLNCVYDKSDLEDMRKQTFKETIKIVKSIASEHNNGWIPCSERLPEECKTVLCCDKDGCCELMFLYKNSVLDENWRVHRGGYRPFENVIAWQPLPERPAPKKGE